MPDTLQTYAWDGIGYQPLVFSDDWQVALLNWESLFDRQSLTEIERHNRTDEVFVLLQGKAILFTLTDDTPLQVVELAPAQIYNVPRAVWHNVIATHDVKFLIVENINTHLHDTEIRAITPEELAALDAQLPSWAK